jgi:aspartate-semialdehyde dehydrogenase
MARSSPSEDAAGRVNIALFDSSTLVGKGIKTHLKRRRFPIGGIRAFDTGAVEAGGNLTEFDGEAMLAGRPDPDEMSQVDLAFFCGGPGTGEPFLEWPERGSFVAIDLTLSANRREGIPVVNAFVNPDSSKPRRGLLASPHPVSQMLSTFLAPLVRRFKVEDVVSMILQPASEAGQGGIEELYRQTVGVLNFTEVPKEQFGRVLAFNSFPASLGPGNRLGEASIAREIASILGAPSFPHAVRVLLSPVFHCHSLLCRVKLHEVVELAKVRDAMTSQDGLRHPERPEVATPAELAGEEGIFVVEVSADSSAPGSFWFWAVTDNLAAGTVENAVRVAEQLLRTGAFGKRGRP